MLSHAALAKLIEQSYGETPSMQASDDVRIMIHDLSDEFVVVCPGTTDFAGWWRDFDWPIKWVDKLGPVHRGFGQGGVDLWGYCRAAILMSGKPVTYTGHSLGGALALVMAALHMAYGWPPCRVITVGAPRVRTIFNPYFVALVAKTREAVEYRRHGDPVVHAPFAPLFLGTARLGHPRIGVNINRIFPTHNHAISLYVSDLEALEVSGK